jgi:hypothetical protein
MLNRRERIAGRNPNRSHRRQRRRVLYAAMFVGTFGLLAGPSCPTPLLAQTFVSGSTGADGAFNPTTDVTLQVPPSGIFNFTTVNIPIVTVTFTRNAANTPVIILASGDVTSSGLIDVGGAAAVGGVPGRGGPGGFDGGLGGNGFGSSPNGAPGLGPGGGQGGEPAVGSLAGSGTGAGYGTAGTANGAAVPGGQVYGVPTLFPLLGGSGGGGGAGGPLSTGPGGGGGGGAIVIASSGTITINAPFVASGVSARGGNAGVKNVGFPQTVVGGCGSGGAIRLIANKIVAGGALLDVRANGCSGGASGNGRIRLEAYELSGSFNGAGVTTISQGLPGPVLPTADTPSVLIVSIGGESVPPAPTASYFHVPDVTVDPSTPNPVAVALQASNVPLGTVIAVAVVTEGVTTRTTFNSTALAGTFASSTATANVTLPPGTSVLTATATFATP